MPRFRFNIEYLGTHFAGWQIQPARRTVQSELQKALHVALRDDITIVGSGRTDAGVHASGQVAHFDTEIPFDIARLERSLNALTSGDVAVRDLRPCEPTFHARYSALSRLYRYCITPYPSAMHADRAWQVGFQLDVEKLRHELQSALGNHDFIDFCLPRHDGKPTRCLLTRAEVGFEVDPFRSFRGPYSEMIVIQLEANRFLHRMVRALVGAATEVARGRIPQGFIAERLAERERLNQTTPSPQQPELGKISYPWNWAPPEGLCLQRVLYAEETPGTENPP